ncbi:MAG: hypothetical protein QNK05_22315 [Myxococcota bacterium]|nr:hypothetical protein [Myxococcota bacterium]
MPAPTPATSDAEFEQIVARVERKERVQRRVHGLGLAWLLLSGLGVLAAGLAFLAIAPWGLAFGDPGAVGFFGILATVVSGGMLALSLPGFVVGLGLLGRRRWARTGAIVLGALALLQVPFGTILGGATLLILLGDDAGPVFGQPARAA